jgi:hypothetical protein
VTTLERIEEELALRAKLNEARTRSFDGALAEPVRALEAQRVVALTAKLMALREPDAEPSRLHDGGLGCASSSGDGKELREWKSREAARLAAEAAGEGLDPGRTHSAVGKPRGAP